jgi:hypothetical protein
MVNEVACKKNGKAFTIWGEPKCEFMMAASMIGPRIGGRECRRHLRKSKKDFLKKALKNASVNDPCSLICEMPEFNKV